MKGGRWLPGQFRPPPPEGVAPLVWGLGCQELKHGANLFSSFYPLVRRWGGQAIGRADADRPHESGGGGPTDGLRPERIRHEVEPASIGDDLLIIVPHPCMRRILPRILTMMQLYASAARLRSSGGPFFFPACKPRVLCERPLPRIVHGGSPLIAAIRQILILLFARFGSASFYAADLNSKPSGTTPVLT